MRAPELPAELEWYNTPEPVTVASQRGRVVLLDFWTYCCINCMHVLPDLRYLEEKYPGRLTVIGIHSPKFPNERVAEQLRGAIDRYEIHHPVAHDPRMLTWQAYGVRAWPSILFIDPTGEVVGVLPGEGRRAQLDEMIAGYVGAAPEPATLSGASAPLATPAGLDLRYPGKVLASEGRLYVSDSGHHRVLECDTEGSVRRAFGTGVAGMRDGGAGEARFANPQGLALHGEDLWVADTDNHAVRRVDLNGGQVVTVAGTGEQGRYPGTFFARPRAAPLNSPWDLAYADGRLYVAMAGAHQIWRLNLHEDTLEVYVGSGREGISDGSARLASLAQPSGLALAGRVLYVADAETSAVRLVRLNVAAVSTLIGSGLFVFGDRDGPGGEARLQHPLGVSWDEGRQRLWIADTYNHKIKWLETTSRSVVTFEIGLALDEPGGLAVHEGVLWVADTNAHRVVRVDLEGGGAEVLGA